MIGAQLLLFMQFDKFTQKSAEALQSALNTAQELRQSELTPVHLALALVEQAEGIVPTLLQKLNQDPGAVASALKTKLESLPKLENATQPSVSAELARVFNQSETEAGKLRDEYISTEHLFLALLENDAIK